MLYSFFAATTAAFMLINMSASAQTPEWMDEASGFSEPAIQQNYADWIAKHKKDAVETAASNRAMIESFDIFGPGVQAMTWSVSNRNFRETRQGGLSYTCIENDPEATLTPFLFSRMSPEDEARKCDWRLWQMDFSPSPERTPLWSAETLDMTTAKAFLREQSIQPDRFGKSTKVDWSGYGPFTALDASGNIRTRTWSSKTCAGVISVLNALEAIEPVQIDIRGFGKEAPVTAGAVRSEDYRSIRIQSGFSTKLEFSGTDGPGVEITLLVDRVLSECAADS